MQKIKPDQVTQALKQNQYIFFDFSSPGCAPCKKVPALLEEIITESENLDIMAYEIDITETPELAQQYMVMGVPTVIIFKDGTEVKRFNSLPKKKKILAVLQ